MLASLILAAEFFCEVINMEYKEALEKSMPFLNQLAAEIKKDIGEVIDEFKSQFESISSSVIKDLPGMTPIIMLGRIQTATEDALCTVVESTGVELTGIITGVLYHYDTNASKINKIKTKMEVPSEKKKLLADGVVREIEGNYVIYDTLKVFPGTTNENKNWNKPLLPKWKMTVVGFGTSSTEPDKIKEFSVTLYDELSNQKSPHLVADKVNSLVGKPIRMTGLFELNENKKVKEKLILGASDHNSFTIKYEHKNIANMALFIISTQIRNKVLPEKRFALLSEKKDWYNKHGKIKGKKKDYDNWDEWTILGSADPKKPQGVRISRVRLNDNGGGKIYVRDDSLPRGLNQYETIRVPSSISIRDENGNPLLTKNSEILPCVRICRENRVYNSDTGQFEAGEGELYYLLCGFTTLVNVGPPSEVEVKDVEYDSVDLDDL